MFFSERSTKRSGAWLAYLQEQPVVTQVATFTLTAWRLPRARSQIRRNQLGRFQISDHHAELRTLDSFGFTCLFGPQENRRFNPNGATQILTGKPIIVFEELAHSIVGQGIDAMVIAAG